MPKFQPQNVIRSTDHTQLSMQKRREKKIIRQVSQCEQCIPAKCQKCIECITEYFPDLKLHRTFPSSSTYFVSPRIKTDVAFVKFHSAGYENKNASHEISPACFMQIRFNGLSGDYSRKQTSRKRRKK